ncbi:unnamed protein product [Tenebrio molitor]|nr:unnamed protein product [Tenebrio molitor]
MCTYVIYILPTMFLLLSLGRNSDLIFHSFMFVPSKY